MSLILHQTFPLGRFHATPWRVNPFDDPFGEWPPSPWRFVRAVVARWYQWNRETRAAPDFTELDELVRVLCESSYAFHLPLHALRGRPLRQYHPVEFGWEPAGKTRGKGENKRPVSRMKSYGTSLVQDNYWCVPRGISGAIWWFIDGDGWSHQVVNALDQCLNRLIYFGRAEAFSRIRRIDGAAPEPNCKPVERAVSSGSVRVLFPKPGAGRADVERVTDDPDLEKRSIPPGARFMYVNLPARPSLREQPAVFGHRKECRLMQIAIGWNVAPEPRAVVRLTARFRSAVLRELLLVKTGKTTGAWSRAPAAVREEVADMFGKDAAGDPLAGHSHAEFLSWWEDRVPTRLLVWRRARPFDADEQAAILRAASRDISWASAGPDAGEWKLRLVPLDESVTPPLGFDDRTYLVWESLTPYVPPRHNLRGGKVRESESITHQIHRELALRGLPGAEQVGVEEFGQPEWVAVHVPRRQGSRQFIGDRRGYSVKLRFTYPVSGPLRLGHSSSFGLGLFKPAAD